jgi:hypothetical protein
MKLRRPRRVDVKNSQRRAQNHRAAAFGGVHKGRALCTVWLAVTAIGSESK